MQYVKSWISICLRHETALLMHLLTLSMTQYYSPDVDSPDRSREIPGASATRMIREGFAVVAVVINKL